jgi:putative DNA primase/helicase
VQVVASQPGWLLDRYFAMAHRVHGDQRGRVRVRFPPEAPRSRPRGTLAAWRSGIAELARRNHAVMFAIMLAFAAPLLWLLRREGGGFQLVARSSHGKTTTAFGGMSVFGLEEEDDPADTWSKTENKFDETAEQRNHLLLVLDETMLADLDDRARARLIEHVAYGLASGRRKGRLGESGRGRRWLLLVLSTSEQASHEIARRGGVRLMAGQLARLTDIVLPCAPERGIFQDLHGAEGLEGFCDRLRLAASENRGIAGDAYLERLVADVRRDRVGLVEWLDARIKHYMGQAKARGAVDRRIAQRFALVYAAGRLAARYGILPYRQAEILAAVRYCHRHAQSEAQVAAPTREPRDGPGDDELVRAVAGNVKRLRPGLVDPRRKPSVAEVKAAPGFVHKGKNGTELLFTPAKFSELVCAGLDERAVKAALKAAGLLVVQKGGKSSVVRDLPQPLGRMRVISVRADIERFAVNNGA